MSPMPLDAINLMPAPVDSPAPAPADSRPSFDEHLQQARQSAEPAETSGAADAPADDDQHVSSESDQANDQPAPPSVPPADEVVAVDETPPEDESGEKADEPALNIVWAVMPILPQLKPTELTAMVNAEAEVLDLPLTEEPTEAPEAKLPAANHRPGVIQVATAPIRKEALDPESGETSQRPQTVATAGESTSELQATQIDTVVAAEELKSAAAESTAAEPSATQDVTAGVDSSKLNTASPVGSVTIASPGVTDEELAVADSDLAIGRVSAKREKPDESAPLPADLPAEVAPGSADGTALNQVEGPTQAKPPGFLVSPRSGGRATESAGMSEADSARFVQRVARAFQVAGEGSGQLRLRLSPPELGSLRLDVSVRQGVLTAHVEAETPQARMLLLDNLPALRDRLQEQNIKLERFDVDLMNPSLGGQPQGFREREQLPENNSSNNRLKTPLDESISRTQSPGKPQLDGGRLNVVV